MRGMSTRALLLTGLAGRAAARRRRLLLRIRAPRRPRPTSPSDRGSSSPEQHPSSTSAPGRLRDEGHLRRATVRRRGRRGRRARRRSARRWAVRRAPAPTALRRLAAGGAGLTARGRTSDGRGTRSPAALPRAQPDPPGPAHLKLLALRGFRAARGGHAAGVVRGLRRLRRAAARRGRGVPVPPTYLAEAAGRRGAVRRLRRADALHRVPVPTGRGARRPASRSPACSAAWGLLAKGTLGVLASLTLAATTEPRDLLVGLERLRMPHLLVQIMGFMIRYLDVVTDELEPDADRRCAPAASTAASAAALAGARVDRGRAVHPLLRARRAGPPGHALARLHRPYAGDPARERDPGAVGPGRHTAWPCPCHHGPGGDPVSAPVLDVSGLAYAYPDGHQALFGVDLHVHQGERVALLGPNGAGKTTLVLHLNGILTAGAGSVAGVGPAGRQGQPAGDPPARGGRVPGPRRPAVHAVRAR